MDGVHDMGGMAGFGPIGDKDETEVFHDDWERRVFGVNIAGLAMIGPVDRVRHAVERIEPAHYLSSSYYEHWLEALEMAIQDLGYASAEEIRTGEKSSDANLPMEAPDADTMEHLIRGGMSTEREQGDRPPRFEVGDRVRTRNFETSGHTRLPRYARGKTGVIEIYHGNHVFPDTVAHDQGENPQPLYSVRFEASELWGDNVERKDALRIDIWEDYLESSS